MKSVICILIVVLILKIDLTSHAQDWLVNGNPSIGPTNYLGSQNNADLIFRTNAVERMRLTTAGFLGLGTANPQSLLDVSNGPVLFQGAIGTNPNIGAGARFIWIPDLRSIRGGDVGVGFGTATYWDTPNVGLCSVGFGRDVLASGQFSVAMGQGNQATGVSSVAFGQNNVAAGNNSLCLGINSNSAGNSSVAVGSNCNVTGNFNVGIGNAMTVTSPVTGFSGAFGSASTINGDECYSFGSQNNISNVGGVCVGSLAIGCLNNITGSNSLALGTSNLINANGSVLLGQQLSSMANNNITVGTGLLGNPLNNGIASTLFAGFNSNVPTLVVTGGNGTVNSFGSVGIGNIVNPTQRLDVNDNARFRTIPEVAPDALILGYDPDLGDTDVDDFVLTHLDFSGSSTDYLAGDGTWAALPANCDWNIVNGGQDLAMGYTAGVPIACVPRNVGVGVLPAANVRFDLFKSVPASTGTEIGQQIQFTGGTGINRGFNGNAIGQPTCTLTHGISFNASGGNQTVGGLFRSIGNGTNNSISVGAAGFGVNTGQFNTTIGLYGRGTNLGCPANRVIGVYAQAVDSIDFNLTCSGGWALYTVGASFSTTTPINLSDASVKTEVTELNEALNVIGQLKPVSYYFTEEAQFTMGTGSDLQYGFVAQELEEVLPELVVEAPGPVMSDDEGNFVASDATYKGIKYTELIPILTAAIQEQQSQIEELKTSINECCAIELKSLQEENNGYSTDVKLSTSQPILFQNTPNPHKGTCVIRYFVPTLEQKSEIQFFDMYGQQIRTLPIAVEGMGQINVDATDLASGTYAYSLVIAEKVFDTKVMIKE